MGLLLLIHIDKHPKETQWQKYCYTCKILESKDVNIYHINVYIYVKEYGEKD